MNNLQRVLLVLMVILQAFVSVRDHIFDGSGTGWFMVKSDI